MTNPIFITIIRLREALESTIEPLAIPGITCLDVGCGDRPYEYLFNDGKYTGIDVEDSGRPINMKKPDYFIMVPTFNLVTKSSIWLFVLKF